MNLSSSYLHILSISAYSLARSFAPLRGKAYTRSPKGFLSWIDIFIISRICFSSVKMFLALSSVFKFYHFLSLRCSSKDCLIFLRMISRSTIKLSLLAKSTSADYSQLSRYWFCDGYDYWYFFFSLIGESSSILSLSCLIFRSSSVLLMITLSLLSLS